MFCVILFKHLHLADIVLIGIITAVTGQPNRENVAIAQEVHRSAEIFVFLFPFDDLFYLVPSIGFVVIFEHGKLVNVPRGVGGAVKGRAYGKPRSVARK